MRKSFFVIAAALLAFEFVAAPAFAQLSRPRIILGKYAHAKSDTGLAREMQFC
jgi:hypothetical protein